MPRAERRGHPGRHRGPEGFTVHPFTEVIFLRHNAGVLLLAEVLIGQNVVLKEQRGVTDVLLLTIQLSALDYETHGERETSQRESTVCNLE